jgi:hypothetical protein
MKKVTKIIAPKQLADRAKPVKLGLVKINFSAKPTVLETKPGAPPKPRWKK